MDSYDMAKAAGAFGVQDKLEAENRALLQRVEELEEEIETSGGSWRVRAEAAEAQLARLREMVLVLAPDDRRVYDRLELLSRSGLEAEADALRVAGEPEGSDDDPASFICTGCGQAVPASEVTRWVHTEAVCAACVAGEPEEGSR